MDVVREEAEARARKVRKEEARLVMNPELSMAAAAKGSSFSHSEMKKKEDLSMSETMKNLRLFVMRDVFVPTLQKQEEASQRKERNQNIDTES